MLKEFSNQEKSVLEYDNYRCVMCGRGIAEGAVLHVEPIQAENSDGETVVVGGLTLCESHTYVREEGKENPV